MTESSSKITSNLKSGSSRSDTDDSELELDTDSVSGSRSNSDSVQDSFCFTGLASGYTRILCTTITGSIPMMSLAFHMKQSANFFKHSLTCSLFIQSDAICSMRVWISASDAIGAGKAVEVVGEADVAGEAGEAGDSTVGVVGTDVGTWIEGTCKDKGSWIRYSGWCIRVTDV
ncbi:hypothetical protein JCGZ_08609 [Jatropha curcas]|uniref:Uncharacterized protein n=1 Tax=Jatropha curcas TaxID=180498 RepID=A0A067KX94_JATCU|nr:hypothetical protein JCGZ_08609 [Jatropha curcas]